MAASHAGLPWIARVPVPWFVTAFHATIHPTVTHSLPHLVCVASLLQLPPRLAAVPCFARVPVPWVATAFETGTPCFETVTHSGTPLVTLLALARVYVYVCVCVCV